MLLQSREVPAGEPTQDRVSVSTRVASIQEAMVWVHPENSAGNQKLEQAQESHTGVCGRAF